MDNTKQRAEKRFAAADVVGQSTITAPGVSDAITAAIRAERSGSRNGVIFHAEGSSVTTDYVSRQPVLDKEELALLKS